MLNTDLLPRPFSYDRPKVEGYEPLISGNVTRISRSKRNAWRAVVRVNDDPLFTGHYDTKTDAETDCAKMIKAYAEVHYSQA